MNRTMRQRLRGLIAALCLAACAAEATPLSLRLDLPSDPVYVGQTVVLTLRLEAVDVGVDRGIRLLRGLDSEALALGELEELAPERSLDADRRQHQVMRWRWRARALRPGVTVLAPAVQVPVIREGQHPQSLIRMITHQVVATPETRLVIQPLPEDNRPADFSGIVGRPAFEVSVSPTRVVVGDLILARIAVSGDRPLDDIAMPRFSPGGGFRVYEPTAVTGAPNSRVTQQILVALATNEAAVPALSLSYFDPQSGRYERITRGPFPLSFTTQEVVQVEVFRPLPAEQATTPGVGPRTEQQPPPPGPARRPARLLPALMTGYGAVGVAAGLLLARFMRRRGIAAQRIGLLGVLAGWGLLAPVAYRRIERFIAPPPSMRVLSDTPARLAPTLTALPLFTVRAGQPARALEQHGDWIRISQGANQGWIPAAAVKRAP